jgi:hypothetical protein
MGGVTRACSHFAAVELRVDGRLLECVIPKLGVFQPREGSRAGRIASLWLSAVVSVEVTNQQSGRGKPASVKLRARSLAPLVKTRGFGMTPHRSTAFKC